MKVNRKGDKEYWFDARGQENNPSTISAVYNTQFGTILVEPDSVGKLHPPSRIKIAVFAENYDDIENIDRVDTVVSQSIDCLQLAAKKGLKTAYYSIIKDAKTMHDAQKMSAEFDYSITKLLHETNIPLELLIAKLQDTRTKLLKEVNTAEAGAIALEVMEKGSDGVVISTNDVKEIYALNKKINESLKGKIDIIEASIENIEHIGMGVRACIDTVSLMSKSEGMIIGSTSSGGILVCAEVHPLPYMDTRPFRVNAGAVHSYVWAPNNRTEYLTDLKVGKKVLCVDTNGVTRSVTVGRIKIETRPLLLIKTRAQNLDINVIVQDDWHVRIFGADGEPKNVTTLKKDDKVLAYLSKPGRHVGIKIDETIIEV